MKTKLENLGRGEVFTLSGIEWKVLSIVDDEGKKRYFAEAVKSIGDYPFDKDNCNDWSKASLRTWLNTSFLEVLEEKHPGIKDYIIPTFRDLTADDGLQDYGSCVDQVTMLTAQEYRETRDLHPAPEDWRWLITADGTAKSSGTCYVRVVYSDGGLSSSDACDGNRGVLPALTLKSDLLVSVPGEDQEEDGEGLSPEQREMALYEGVVDKFGEKAQILMAVEEMSELTKALLKYIRFKDFNQGSEGDILAAISEERADVEIMLNQLQVIFGDNSEADCLALEHLAELLEDAE